LAVPRCKGAAAKGRRYYARFGRQKHAARAAPPPARAARRRAADTAAFIRGHSPFVHRIAAVHRLRMCYTPRERTMLFP